MQVKIALVHVLKNFSVEVCDQTPERIKLNKKSIIMIAGEPMMLKFIQNELF